MVTRLEVPVSILSDGTACVVIAPNSLFTNNTYTAGTSSFVPFVSVSGSSSTAPFLTIPTNAQSPFYTQAANISTYALDSLKLDYVHT